MIKKELGFIYLEKNEIAYYMANLWMSELHIQNIKTMKYSKEKIHEFHNELWKLINRNWEGKSALRLTRKGRKQDPILSQACDTCSILYYDLPKEFSVFRPIRHAIEWRNQLHPCKFLKNNTDDIERFMGIGEP